ncbi:MAG: hypothetical protein HY897_13705, partial [Deltaproteobacteria bacterium]|nr:hypothetical protein [Deltaproteobacteria bacterium]
YYDLDQYLEDAAGVVGKPDAGVPADAGMERDAGADAGTTDTGTSDTGWLDAGEDTGSTDTGSDVSYPSDASDDGGPDAGEDAGPGYLLMYSSVYEGAAGRCEGQSYILDYVTGWGASPVMTGTNYVLERGTVVGGK